MKMSHQIAAYIGEHVSPGLGYWPRAWDLVADASAEFDAACSRWAEEGHVGGYQAAEQAGTRLVEAWQAADAEFQGRGAYG